MTMEQLMSELRIQGVNFDTFDKQAFARITVTTTERPDNTTKIEQLLTTSAHTKITLYFTASPGFIGDYPRGDVANNPRKMLIKLFDCAATNGTRVIHYDDKFASNQHSGGGRVNVYRPDLPSAPELEREYILHWYFKEGDPFEAKATISFSETPFSK